MGEDVENILLKLIQAADFDVKKAETGIIYIDEVDKIARRPPAPVPRRMIGDGHQRIVGKVQRHAVVLEELAAPLETSRVIDGFSLLRAILSTSSM